MQALKKIGDLEDSLRERLGEIYNCDPDELPIDFDLSDIYGAPSGDRIELLVRVPSILLPSIFLFSSTMYMSLHESVDISTSRCSRGCDYIDS